MKEKFIRFMEGRYGVDQLSKFTMAVALIFIILSLFIRGTGGVLLNTIGLLAIVYTYFRIFSRNIQARYGENQKYLNATQKLRYRINKEKSIMEQRKTHHIYSCPGCGQKIRIPKGKGRIEIDCPKCHTKFIKNS